LDVSVCATAADPNRASTAAIGKIRIEAPIEDTFAARDSSGRNFQALQVNREIFHAGVMDIVVAGCGATPPFLRRRPVVWQRT
jgi:hypothetical protein